MFKFKKKSKKSAAASSAEKRRYLRFPIMYHLDVPVTVRILPHYRSEEFEARLDNFSAGGLAIRIPKLIPEKNFMYIQVTLPNKLCVACHSEVKHFKKLNTHEYLLGVQFLDLPAELKNLIFYMSREYITCGDLIKQHVKFNCSHQCTAYTVCSRHEKIPRE